DGRICWKASRWTTESGETPKLPEVGGAGSNVCNCGWTLLSGTCSIRHLRPFNTAKCLATRTWFVSSPIANPTPLSICIEPKLRSLSSASSVSTGVICGVGPLTTSVMACKYVVSGFNPHSLGSGGCCLNTQPTALASDRTDVE